MRSDKGRLNRALKNRLYLISANQENSQEWNFSVEGTTGNIYNVNFNKEKLSCTCPDYRLRNNICKHIYFIIGRVLKDLSLMDELGNSPDISIFSVAKDLSERLNNVLYDRLNKQKVEPNNLTIPEEECCPICYEDYEENESADSLSRCNVCKKFIHTECLNVWLKRGGNCPLCRSLWIREESSDDPMKKFKKKKLKRTISEYIGNLQINDTKDTEMNINLFRRHH